MFCVEYLQCAFYASSFTKNCIYCIVVLFLSSVLIEKKLIVMLTC